ncbi:A-kinase anchor protein SPHKAP [Bufo bufo]|uniref:A-kinase anchor protein SPHKAP n=1 Tax=Bufo bufo TaxID=8384 RepID=UPI001ABDE397|nr:A-kinase anchor protein SPHKAP [Bufo bufo]
MSSCRRSLRRSCDLSAMYGPTDKDGNSGGNSINDTSTSNLGSSITACKKVICPKRHTDSLEYWLQNSKNLCKISLVEESMEPNCTSICFVNLKDDSQHEASRKKLGEVSPDLQRLINSMRSQELAENEILLLSGLSNRKCEQIFENQQVWQPDEICLLLRGKTENTSNAIILELNKFILGLKLAQENHLQPDTSPLRAEDDTNCSVSSIEEDFLTASETLEEDSEGEICKGEPPDDIKNVKRKAAEHSQSIKIGRTNLRSEEYNVIGEPREEIRRKLEERRTSLIENNFEYKTGKNECQCIGSNVQQSPLCQDDHYTEYFEDPASTGQYATNLAECVLQDAFIRLSQSDNSFTKEAALSISAGNSAVSGFTPREGSPAASRSWNDLPKIVIVQSPDSCDSPTEWVDESQWPEQENIANNSDNGTDEDTGSTQSTLEVALACAASVIGTFSSPQPSDPNNLEHHENIDVKENDTVEENTTDIVGFPSCMEGLEFSVPSALCGMTRVASAVAVCGLGEQRQGHYPATSSGLLLAADASTAVALHCSIALGTSMEKLKDNIAKALLREAALVLTSPCKYKNVGEFIESINEKILSSVSSAKFAHVGDVVNDDLAHNLSDTILRHSAEKAVQGVEVQHCSTTPNDFVATTTELLFNVMHFTCKKMNDLVQSGDLPSNVLADRPKSLGVEKRNSQVDETVHRNKSQLTNLCSSPEQRIEPIPLKHPSNEVNGGNTLPAETYCSTNSQAQIKAPCSKQCLRRERYKRHHNDQRARESILIDDDCRYCVSDKGSMDGGMSSGSQEKVYGEIHVTKEFALNLSSGSSNMLHPSQAVLLLKHPVSNYCLSDFADDLAETVVSMATEIAAICLENSNGKQPWFCAWAKGSECLLTPCRTAKRKKDTSSGGSVVRRHRPPRLSEIKKKTDEHPELKERLMNRVVDESINLEDAPDPVSAFANEVASKIMNLTESSVADSLWQGQNLSRNRLHCDRWSRGKASSYESIPEEDLNAKSLVNTLGPWNMLGQPFSRTSSVSKQSSCESITDEFSRFMVNQMENEGREFELLLDYYAGRNANSILNSALQQISRRNSLLNVKPTCLSKQSSTESITEEFYRYMLKEIDKESKEMYSSRNTAEWTNNLMPPSSRTPFCFRQSSMPCTRSSSARLTVNTPVKANSLDGFSRSGSRDFLNIQPANSISSTNLCKSDSCLYQRWQTDQATDMLIHETWSSSIEALMRKNKIIADRTESVDAEASSSPKGSPAHVDRYAKMAVDIVQSGKSLLVQHQDSYESTNKGNFKNNNQNGCKSMDIQESIVVNISKLHQLGSSGGPLEVPLIQIEMEQKEEIDGADQAHLSKPIRNIQDIPKQDEVRSICHVGIRSCQVKQGTERSAETKPRSELPTPLSSSEDSTGSWSQLVNDEDNPEDTSSFLQLSERSTSVSNGSTRSSIGAVDLDAFLEIIPPGPTADMENSLAQLWPLNGQVRMLPNPFREGRRKPEKTVTKDVEENSDECTSGLSVGTVSCQHEVSILNIDLDSDCSDYELRITLQWIAASELGAPAVYFRKSQESRIQKFLEITQLVQAKSWKVGDIFSALILHCKVQEQRREATPSFFDWLLELG